MALQCSTGVHFFMDTVPMHLLFSANGRLEQDLFLKGWKGIEGETVEILKSWRSLTIYKFGEVAVCPPPPFFFCSFGSFNFSFTKGFSRQCASTLPTIAVPPTPLIFTPPPPTISFVLSPEATGLVLFSCAVSQQS